MSSSTRDRSQMKRTRRFSMCAGDFCVVKLSEGFGVQWAAGVDPESGQETIPPGGSDFHFHFQEICMILCMRCTTRTQLGTWGVSQGAYIPWVPLVHPGVDHTQLLFKDSTKLRQMGEKSSLRDAREKGQMRGSVLVPPA